MISKEVAEPTVKSFNSNFDVKLLSVKGNKNDQTVTVSFMISHKLVHQKICFHQSDFMEKLFGKIYDYNGNAYEPKFANIGTNKGVEGLYNICATVPSNVPVKASVTFKQILPDVDKISFMNLTVAFGANDGYSLEKSDLEISNMKIDWK